jgi:Mn2+/Fe2+ NRAMP family transporter
VRILFLTQVLNAVLLLPLLIALRSLGRDPAVMGELRNGRGGDALALAALAIVAASVLGLAVAAFL